jgi:hypothetical protein
LNKRKSPHTEEYRAQSPLEVRRQHQTTRKDTITIERALVTMCTNSIKVCDWVPEGRISPLHRGQRLPHPAPDPETRTYAPQRMTAILYATTNQAKGPTETDPILEMVAGVKFTLATELRGRSAATLTVVPMIPCVNISTLRRPRTFHL